MGRLVNMNPFLNRIISLSDHSLSLRTLLELFDTGNKINQSQREMKNS